MPAESLQNAGPSFWKPSMVQFGRGNSSLDTTSWPVNVSDVITKITRDTCMFYALYNMDIIVIDNGL